MNAPANTGPGRRRYQRCLAALAVLAVGLATLEVTGAGPVSAAPGDITEFTTGITTNSFPLGIAPGSDGNLWFTEVNRDRIGRITPTGAVTEFSTGITPGSEPWGIAPGSDGNLWFTEYSGTRIGRITPAGTITEYSTGLAAGSTPNGITAGPDGNLWFTELNGNRIGRITPAGTVTEFSSGLTPGSGPNGITAGPDGNLWFTEFNGNRIGRITPAGTVTEFADGVTVGRGPDGITAGPDGNLWFAYEGGERIGRITPAGTITEYPTGITDISGPDGITAGPDGNLWFTDGQGPRIGRITPTGTVTVYTAGITPGSQLWGITTGPDGNLWFANDSSAVSSRIDRFEMSPRATLSPVSRDFGEQALRSTSGPQQFTVTNTGTAPLVVGAASITGTNPGDFTAAADHCSGVTVAPDDSCTIDVTFTPAAVGARSATLSIPDNAAGSPHTAALTGTGTPAASTVLLSATPNPSTFGDPVTVTAHVSTAAPVTPTGIVAFADGATALGTAVVDGTGTATLTTTTLHGGQHQITATYSGDANLLTSSATTGQTVNAAATTLTARPAQLVVQLPGTSGLRLSARLAVTSTDAPIAGQPIAMRVNGTTACTANTAPNGVATCTAPLIYLLGITLHGYTATYPGTADYQPATGHAGLLG